MKLGTLFVVTCITISFWCLASRFIDAKIKNDSSIAVDTKRIADALEKKRCP